MRFLLFTTLYPNAQMPTHGVFVENRLRAFLKKVDADVKVVAPVPWFPFHNETFGVYGRWAGVPARETRHGVKILHPRYGIPPKVGMRFAPKALMRCFRKTAKDLIKSGWDFDFIDAHYFYPDGVAAVQIAKELAKPVVVTARGTDINHIPQFSQPRADIVKASHGANAIICVADALKNELIKLGSPAQNITTLRNGVDLELFKPLDRQAIRKSMGLAGLVIASVGLLMERKGHDRVIEALRQIPGATLLIVGDGPMRASLEALAALHGVKDRIRFLGAVAHEDLPDIYNAADVITLASSREGWPNVLLEAMACGTPCVATPVWGSGEVITAPEAGVLSIDRSAEAIASAIWSLLDNAPERTDTRAYAERFSWDETVDGMATMFERLSNKARANRTATITAVKTETETYTPKLIVTVDTEEKFDWSNFDTIDHSVCAPNDLDAFQKICSEVGAKPLYLLTYPLLKSPGVGAYFKNLRDQGAADCGLHLHQWVTPGIETIQRYSGEYFSFQHNLPYTAYISKLKTLARAYQAVFGAPALSHRAGRYGISPADYALLAEIGVRNDFSPSAGFDFSAKGGPDFSSMSNYPFTISPPSKPPVSVTPVCGAKAIKRTSSFLSQNTNPPGFAPPQPSLTNAFTRAMRLSPEGASLNDLKALTNKLIKDQTPVLTFTLHSTSLTVGANPYGQTAQDVAQMLAVTRDYLAWFRDKLDGQLISESDLDALYNLPRKSADI